MTSAFSAVHRPLHTIGVAALSLSSLCFAARGQDSQVAPSPESRPAASDSLHPLLSAPTRYMRKTLGSAKPVVSVAAGVELQADSSALSALSRAAAIWDRGEKAASGDVLSILKACIVEPGSSVKPERLRAILSQYRDTPALQ